MLAVERRLSPARAPPTRSRDRRPTWLTWQASRRGTAAAYHLGLSRFLQADVEPPKTIRHRVPDAPAARRHQSTPTTDSTDAQHQARRWHRRSHLRRTAGVADVATTLRGCARAAPTWPSTCAAPMYKGERTAARRG